LKAIFINKAGQQRERKRRGK